MVVERERERKKKKYKESTAGATVGVQKTEQNPVGPTTKRQSLSTCWVHGGAAGFNVLALTLGFWRGWFRWFVNWKAWTRLRCVADRTTQARRVERDPI